MFHLFSVQMVVPLRCLDEGQRFRELLPWEDSGPTDNDRRVAERNLLDYLGGKSV